ncbi:ArsR family transcriptional regulator [Desulfobaculum xiamenense]|uniref:ArsR family transcriptional regulator n=1 Tax=Desulfobaculum xiamenense TaxID=995050 RepID=A0A846QPN7_9BACT|nr:metalloregulator ArsR/SmtB family transcription factor [Desulfobaculum xiamenense]NJB68950.1 ArsR family transcriptional regulator [Desulfobaculum xiamenense]
MNGHRDTCDATCKHPDAIEKVRRHSHATERFSELADLFKVLGDPTRVRILHALSVTELCVCDIAALLCMTSSAVSHQLRLLRQAKLVRNRKDGKSVYYALDDDHVRLLMDQGLAHVLEDRSGRTD